MKISGNELIEWGYRPGKWFKSAIEEINRQRMNVEEAKIFLEEVAPKIIHPHSTAKHFYQNIEAETADERENVNAVINSMYTLMKTPTLIEGTIMPDACPTGSNGQIPVGGVAVAENAIHPAMHSADICCSVMMTSFGMIEPKKVLDMAHGVTHFGPGGRQLPFELPKEIDTLIKSNRFLKGERSRQLAKTHFGTQGDGNHFLFVGQSETTGETIMVTHHGSRGFGANLYKLGMKLAEQYRKLISPKTLKVNAWIPYDEKDGKEYWEALQAVRQWTKANHNIIHQKTLEGLNADIHDQFWNEHNFVFKKANRFYHAKGATPLDDAFVPDSSEGRRLIPLNMSEPVLIVEGETTQENLGFAPHGAGRNISRTAHKRRNEGKSKESIFAKETKGLDVRFYSGEIDISELPSAYKNADQVQQQMKKFNLGEVQDRILPYGCIMAGDWLVNARWRKRRKK